MSRYFLIFFLLSISQKYQVTSTPSFTNIKEIIEFCYDVAKEVKTGYELYEKYFEHKQDIMEMVMDALSDIPVKLDQMESRLSYKMDAMVQILLDKMPLIDQINHSMRELHNYIVRVDGMYENYSYYSKDKNNFNNYTIRRFINTVTSDNLGDLQDILNKIHRLVLPDRTSHIRESLLLQIGKEVNENYLGICDNTLSPAQQLFELYATIVLTEIRGYAMTAFAYGLLPRFENQTFSAELDKAEAKLAIRCREYLKAIQKSMLNAPKDIRRCDPKYHQRYSTFYELEELFQAYIISEPDVEYNSCTRTCPTLTSQRAVTCIDTQFCPHYRICQGSVTDCEYGGGKMEICETSNSSRRYEWFKDNSGFVYGNNSAGCPGNKINPQGWIRGFVRCDYCICTCSASDPDSKAIRTISLMSQTSDINNNMVVTGLKFVLKGHMIQIQIKEGKLLPEGIILNTTESWKPLENIQWSGKTEWSAQFYINRDDKKEILNRTKNYDYVTRYHNTIYLDDIVLPEGYLVTGVRMAHDRKPAENGVYQPFILEIQSTPFDILTGKLTFSNNNPPKWINARKLNNPLNINNVKRTELKLNRPDNPIKSVINLPTSHGNQFMEFRASDFRKDAGQSTVPFFDGQAVETKPAVPLRGVGLLHRGADGYGGFFSFRVFTVDMATKINFDIDEDLMRSYRKLYTTLDEVEANSEFS